MIRKGNGTANAFTIVELLIVIVVIGILAAITIVAYNGISSRARIAGLQSTLAATAKLIENGRTTAGTTTYPASVTNLDPTVTYSNGIAGIGGFCAYKTDSTITYMTTSTNKTPHLSASGSCTLTNLVTNPSFEAATTGWTGASNLTALSRTGISSTGSFALNVTRANATAGNGYVSTPMTTVVGTQYSVSFAIALGSGSPAISAAVKNTSATGSIPGDSSALSITPTATYNRYTLTWTAEATTTYLVIDTTNAVTGQTYYIDSVFAVAGANAGAYVDPLISSDWTWTGGVGNANNATSSGPAF
jgi:prepilin-type N-terminal cleavage/methylation domain-containing protein